MEWWPVIVTIAWNFGCGFMAGRWTAPHNTRAEVLDDIFTRAVKDGRQFHKFADVNCITQARLLDEQGKTWIVSIEREKELA